MKALIIEKMRNGITKEVVDIVKIEEQQNGTTAYVYHPLPENRATSFSHGVCFFPQNKPYGVQNIIFCQE